MTTTIPALLGDSSAMRHLRHLISRIAVSRLPVLIEGETGTGKELVANAIHHQSGRKGRLVAFNVCAIPETMFESTLFGHAKGAFTGALHQSDGFLTEANHGSAFFDEIGTLSVPAQGKLLRAIETGIFRPVGGRADLKSDFRVVSASNESLMRQVAIGGFRADLAHRLSGCVISVPPLRQRKEDIPFLVRNFVQLAGERPIVFASDALALLSEYAWPGNVRELRMMVERLVVLVESELVNADEILAILPTISNSHHMAFETPITDTAERDRLQGILDNSDNDTARAAMALGIHRSTLYRRLAHLGIRVPAKAAERGASH